MAVLRRRSGSPTPSVAREMVPEVVQAGIERGEIRDGVDVERVLDLLLGALFGAVFAQGRPGPAWPEAIVDALWPALVAGSDERK